MTTFRQAVREGLWIVLAACILGFVYSYSTGKGLFGPASETRMQVIAATAPSMIHLEEARRLYDLNQALFVDSRHAFDFEKGHIRGAVNVPLASFEEKRELVRALPKDKVLITYCDGADCNSSIELAVKLQEAGFSGVKVFFGGWYEWLAQSLPVEESTR